MGKDLTESFKLQVHNYCVSGKITDIHESRDTGLIPLRHLSFRYYCAKMRCSAIVTFSTDEEFFDLYKPALRFIKRLNYN